MRCVPFGLRNKYYAVIPLKSGIPVRRHSFVHRFPFERKHNNTRDHARPPPQESHTDRHTHTMLGSLFGPLFQLQWFGRILPCWEKDEDRNARQAVAYWQGRYVMWRRVTVANPPHSLAGAAGDVLQNIGRFFRRTSSSFSNDDVGNHNTGGSNHPPGDEADGHDNHSTTYSTGSSNTPILARCVLCDDDHGQPELCIIPISPAPEEEPTGHDGSHVGNQRGGTSSLSIRLGRMDRVTLEGNEIILMSRRLQNGPAKELVRMAAVAATASGPTGVDDGGLREGTAVSTTTTNTTMFVPDDVRNLLVHHMAVLIEWERQRRIRDPESSLDDDDEDDEYGSSSTLSGGNFLRIGAQKAKHFAQREFELQNTKREREKRKAQLVAEAGGLKYTALAMANRTDV